MKKRIINMGNMLIVISSIITGLFFLLSKVGLELQPPFQILAQISSLLGLLFLSWTYILSLRHRVVESMFNGLDKVYKLHHLLGGLSFILLLHHPLFLILNRLPQNTLKLYLLPSVSQSYTLGVIALYLLAFLLVLTLFVDMPYRLWKWTHEWMGLVILIGGLHSVLVVSDISRYAPLRYWMITWTAAALLSALYKRFFYYLFQQSKNYQVVDIKQNSDIFYLTLFPREGFRPLYFQPGQYGFISLPDSRDEHPFTVLKQKGQKITFAIKCYGLFTKGISQKKPGEVLTLRGPFGYFASSVSKAPQVWIAGGIGVTPFVSMLGNILPDQEVTLFWSCRDDSLSEINSIFQNYSESYPNFSFIPINTCQDKHISVEKLNSMDLVDSHHRYYLCGPLSMMTQLSDQLVSVGIKQKHIIYEDFSFK